MTTETAEQGVLDLRSKDHDQLVEALKVFHSPENMRTATAEALQALWDENFTGNRASAMMHLVQNLATRAELTCPALSISEQSDTAQIVIASYTGEKPRKLRKRLTKLLKKTMATPDNEPHYRSVLIHCLWRGAFPGD